MNQTPPNGSASFRCKHHTLTRLTPTLSEHGSRQQQHTTEKHRPYISAAPTLYGERTPPHVFPLLSQPHTHTHSVSVTTLAVTSSKDWREGGELAYGVALI